MGHKIFQRKVKILFKAVLRIFLKGEEAQVFQEEEVKVFQEGVRILWEGCQEEGRVLQRKEEGRVL